VVKGFLQSIDGLEMYAEIALVLFVLAFVGIVVWAVRMKPAHLAEMSRMPLDADDSGGEE